MMNPQHDAQRSAWPVPIYNPGPTKGTSQKLPIAQPSRPQMSAQLTKPIIPSSVASYHSKGPSQMSQQNTKSSVPVFVPSKPKLPSSSFDTSIPVFRSTKADISSSSHSSSLTQAPPQRKQETFTKSSPSQSRPKDEQKKRKEIESDEKKKKKKKKKTKQQAKEKEGKKKPRYKKFKEDECEEALDDEAEEGETESEGEGEDLDQTSDEEDDDDEEDEEPNEEDADFIVEEYEVEVQSGDSESDGEDAEDAVCVVCESGDNEAELLLCDGCNGAYHTFCIGLSSIPEGDFFCKDCPLEEVIETKLVKVNKKTGERTVQNRKFTIVDDVKWIDANPVFEEDEPISADEDEEGEQDAEDDHAETDAEDSDSSADEGTSSKKTKKKKKKQKGKVKVKGKEVEGNQGYDRKQVKRALDQSDKIKKGKTREEGERNYNNHLAGMLHRAGASKEEFKQVGVPWIPPNEIKEFFGGLKFDGPPANPPTPKTHQQTYKQKPASEPTSNPNTPIPPIEELVKSKVMFRDETENYFHPKSGRYFQRRLIPGVGHPWSEITGPKLRQLQNIAARNQGAARAQS